GGTGGGERKGMARARSASRSRCRSSELVAPVSLSHQVVGRSRAGNAVKTVTIVAPPLPNAVLADSAASSKCGDTATMLMTEQLRPARVAGEEPLLPRRSGPPHGTSPACVLV